MQSSRLFLRVFHIFLVNNNKIFCSEKVIFLDKDGVLIFDTGYPKYFQPEMLLPGVVSALKFLQGKGYRLVVVTNQSGIGRGFFSERHFRGQMVKLLQYFNQFDVVINTVLYCPHVPSESGNCKCRKPNIGMLVSAYELQQFDKKLSFMIGDSMKDIQCATSFDIKPIYFGDSAPLSAEVDLKTAGNWSEVVDFF